MGQFTFRLPDDIHTKARIVAAYRNISLNELCAKAVRDAVKDWEEKYSEIPMIEDFPEIAD